MHRIIGDVAAPLRMESNDGRGPITVAITFRLAVCGPHSDGTVSLYTERKETKNWLLLFLCLFSFGVSSLMSFVLCRYLLRS